jgi:hypothetical protein
VLVYNRAMPSRALFAAPPPVPPAPPPVPAPTTRTSRSLGFGGAHVAYVTIGFGRN